MPLLLQAHSHRHPYLAISDAEAKPRMSEVANPEPAATADMIWSDAVPPWPPPAAALGAYANVMQSTVSATRPYTSNEAHGESAGITTGVVG